MCCKHVLGTNITIEKFQVSGEKCMNTRGCMPISGILHCSGLVPIAKENSHYSHGDTDLQLFVLLFIATDKGSTRTRTIENE